MNKLLKIIGEGFKFIAFFIIIIFSIELIKFVFISCILIWAYLMSIYPQHIEIISLVIKMNSYYFIVLVMSAMLYFILSFLKKGVKQ